MFYFCNKDQEGLGKLLNLVIHEDDNKYYFPRYINNFLPTDNLTRFEDKNFKPSKVKKFKFKKDLRESQQTMLDDVLSLFPTLDGVNGIIQARPGTGKCHALNQPILMYDGTIKLVQDVRPNDKLMGPDSQYRRVMSTSMGYGKLYKVTLDNNDSFTCNEDHIFCLKATKDFDKYVQNEIINISLKEYIDSTSEFKLYTRMWKTEVHFKYEDTYFNPTKVGVYLAYKYLNNIYKSNINIDVLNSLDIRTYIYYNNLRHDDCIPKKYKINTCYVRYEFLSGIFDSIGEDDYTDKGYRFVSYNDNFINELKFVADSVGFRTTKEYDPLGQAILFIAGDIDILAVRNYKKNRFSNTDTLYNFKIEHINEDSYYGFTLDDDNLYLLDNFIVTHNTVFTIYLSHLINKKTLILIDKDDLINQWRDEYKEYTNLKDEDFGLIKGDVWDVENKTIIFSTPQTLAAKIRKDVKEFYAKFVKLGIDFVCFDENHKIGNSYASASLLFNTKNLIGLSATPWHSGDRDILMKSVFNSVITEYGTYDYAPEMRFINYNSGLGAKYGKSICWLWENQFMQARAKYNKILLESERWSNLLVDIIKEEYKNENNFIIVILMTVDQVNFVYEKVALDAGIKGTKYYSKQKKINKGKDRLLFATYNYASDAFDYKELNRLILPVVLMGKKSLVQTIGRVVRESKNKEDVKVFDFIDNDGQFRGTFTNTKIIKRRILENEFDECEFIEEDRLN